MATLAVVLLSALWVALPAQGAAAAPAPQCSGPASFVCDAAEAVIHGPTTVGLLAHKAKTLAGQGLGSLAEDAFGVMAQRFGEAGIAFLRSLADAFVATSTVDLSKSGIDPVMAITMPIATLIAVLLVVVAAGRAAMSGKGSVIATALMGVAKAALITVMVVTVTQMALRASDELSTWIIHRSLGGDEQLQQRLGTLITLDALDGSPALVLLFGLLAIALALALWGELLFRRVAIVLLVALAPIAATGLVLDETSEWWGKARNALIQLVMVKPVIALCFAVGFSTFGTAEDLTGVIAGFVTLGLAALAWPLVAKFMTFTAAGGGHAAVSGLVSSAAGFLAGRRLAGAPASGPASVAGTGYTLALEKENDAAAVQGAASVGSRLAGGRAIAGGGAGIGAAAAVAAVGAAATAGAAVLDHLESHASSAAADAGLGHGTSPRGSYGATPGRFGARSRRGASSVARAGGGTTHLPASRYAGHDSVQFAEGLPESDGTEPADVEEPVEKPIEPPLPVASGQQEGAPL